MNNYKIFKELKDQEWKQFIIENSDNGLETTIFLKSLFTIDSYSIIITDLTMVWCNYSNLESIINDKDEYNEHLDSPIEKILDILRDSINENKKDTSYKLSIPKSHYKLSFSLFTKISFYSFKWIFQCEPIEEIIDSNSWKVHSQWIKDNFIIPTMFLCKNLLNTKQLLTKQLEKVLKYVNSNNINNNTNTSITSNNSNLNNSSLSASQLVGDSKRLNLSITSKKIGVNIYQAIPILSETIKPEDFKDNNFNFFNDPIFSQYYDFLNHSNNNNIDNSNSNKNHNVSNINDFYDKENSFDYSNGNQLDLNETVEENFLDNGNSNLSSSKTRVINKTTSATSATSTNSELSLFYDVCSTPKKNYGNNSRNRNKTNSSNPSMLASLPSSISNIHPNSLSSYSSSQNFDDFNTTNDFDDSNITKITNNLKDQFEPNENEEVEEKKRKLELEEKLEQSKQKQLYKKKKTKFV
ncbi:hypothetical protein DICPUDRAFT_157416 [Dictyostelium purpureum]|uniref:Non-homologous end-joining factor 1 n=1 Tax=Dictyostelium purpureum TaxID=5786 RepID=F0ZZ29_DICPU|nr:uncharacterized protein DICPUDRAFT_157416 [Dictyostelium purpureum]EGC30803.1 hypothetical protein DICPUDRAFT_157416 [Dictyostelium purpureum]|eukprot:XP_003292670.1 hypothetical protein DICPUDRAFT_157416 [Dictyostelium purpureum]